jgi:hypothetical protein
MERYLQSASHHGEVNAFMRSGGVALKMAGETIKCPRIYEDEYN